MLSFPVARGEWGVIRNRLVSGADYRFRHAQCTKGIDGMKDNLKGAD